MNKEKDKKQSIIYLIDSSALLSGKPFPLDEEECWTVEEIANEFSPGGASFRNFVYLQEKGLRIHQPSEQAKKKVALVIEKMGEKNRLSIADQAILALAVDVKDNVQKQAVILTDDYSIQNIARVLQIKVQGISKRGITKTFKWRQRCRGCGRLLSQDESTCRICGSDACYVVDTSQPKPKNNGDPE
ncbi:MAG: NOB1 family endonuclease [Candidatus Thermoplasmatota archaeon]|nr:NOB1 family endonuclease [Candidatus Thermoplasmatota archaeon]